MMTGEVSEEAAPVAIAAGYARIRSALRSTFVPTVYRRLAIHPAAFELAVDHLPRIVSLGDSTDFVRAAQRAARLSGAEPPMGHDLAHFEVTQVVQRYRKANPLNLLFSMSIAGPEARPVRPVMEPPLGSGPGDIWQDILHCHGDVIIPGLWRDLAPWPSDLELVWRSTRAMAQEGRLVPAREAVMDLAIQVLSDDDTRHLSSQIGHLLPAEAVTDLAWFPTGVATMVVEGEWLHHLMSHPQGRNPHEHA